MTTDDQFIDTFRVFDVEQISENSWAVSGRVLETVTVGDTVHIQTDQGALAFEVGKIIFHGHSIHDVDPVLTAKLVLMGSGGEAIEDINLLKKTVSL